MFEAFVDLCAHPAWAGEPDAFLRWGKASEKGLGERGVTVQLDYCSTSSHGTLLRPVVLHLEPHHLKVHPK